MKEKELIEKYTAEGFLKLYNEQIGENFHFEKNSDSPDVVCVNAMGIHLYLEITLTEDRQGDIPSNLGRSDQRSPENFKKKMDLVGQGKLNILDTVSCLNTDVFEMLKITIKKKINKDYGINVALVIRDTSGCDWDWDTMIGELEKCEEFKNHPYDKGIWLINNSKDRLFRLL